MPLQFQSEEARPDVAQIVSQLNSRNKAVRETAAESIKQMGPDAIDTLLAILAQEAQKRKKRRHIMLGVTGGYVTLMLGLSILTHNHIFVNMVGSMSGTVAAASAATKTQKSLSYVLTQFEDTRLVGVLAEALEYGDNDLRRLVEPLLSRVLPRLQASDAHLLNKEQRDCLNRALKGKNKALVLAILQAYQQVGDARAISAVKRLVNGEGRLGRDAEVRQAARECLPFLEMKEAQEKNSRQLLRASSNLEAAQAAPDMLLRPASGVIETEPEQLLRASNTSQG